MIVEGIRCPECLTGKLRRQEDGGTDAGTGETFHWVWYDCINPDCLARFDEAELDALVGGREDI